MIHLLVERLRRKLLGEPSAAGVEAFASSALEGRAGIHRCASQGEVWAVSTVSDEGISPDQSAVIGKDIPSNEGAPPTKASPTRSSLVNVVNDFVRRAVPVCLPIRTAGDVSV